METLQTTGTAADGLALLSEVFERAPAFMAVLSGEEHVFEMVNAAYYQLVGHREVLGKPLLTALPEVAGQGFMELLDNVLRTGVPFVGTEMKILLQMAPNAPLTERYLNFVYQARKDAQGRIVGIFAHGVDVTELAIARRESEERAQQMKQQAQAFDTLLTNIADFVYTFDRDGRFTYSNRPLLDLLGITLEQIQGKNFHDLPYPEELATTLQAYIQQVIETKEQIVDETPYVSPKGTLGYYEYIFTPVFGEDGQVVSVAGSTRDISERVLHDRQKDEFLAIVSHELKTPVTSLKAYAQRLQRKMAKEGHTLAVEQLAKMDAQINRLTGLIGDLLDLTMIDNGKLGFHYTSFAFDEIVAETIDEVQRATEDHVITCEGATNATLFGDRNRIGQVLINILTNAVKYSPGAENIIVTPTADAESVTLRVQDFGEGISAERLPHVFERFYHAPGERRRTVPGLGLGLFVSAEIIQRHAGKIWVESEQGKGSTVCFTLPVQSSSAV